MTAAAEHPAPGDVVALDLLLRVPAELDRYATHAVLDQHFGRRGTVGYLWAPGQVDDGPAVRLRVPPDHADGAAGLPVVLPLVGARCAFRLCANVTHKIGISGKRASWPLDLAQPRLDWLGRRAQAGGFAIEDARVATLRVHVSKGHGFWIDASTFTGTLSVTDTTVFAHALARGVGPRPAFGFGLLELFPLP
jgi:hypothetical protein